MSTFDPYEPQQLTVEEPKKSGCGCFLIGCLGVIAVSVIAMVGVSWFAYRSITGQVEKYTAETPQEIPVVEYSDEQLTELRERIESFRLTANIESEGDAAGGKKSPTTSESSQTSAEKNVEPQPSGAAAAGDAAQKSEAGDSDTDSILGPTAADAEPDADTKPESVAARELVLTADQINALISAEDALKGRLHVKIDDGELSGDVSIPTDAIPLINSIPKLRGRFFNASGTFDVSLENGFLVVRMVAAEVKGEPVPDDVMSELSNQNLAKDIYDNPDVAKTLRKFESIRVEGDTLVLRLRDEQDDDKPTEVRPEPEAPPSSPDEKLDSSP